MAIVTQTTRANFFATYAGLTNQGDDQVVEITDAGTITGNFIPANNLTDLVTIRPASGLEYNQDSPTDPHVRFISSSGRTIEWRETAARVTVTDIAVESTGTSPGDSPYHYQYFNANFEFINCLFEGGYENAPSDAATADARYTNCTWLRMRSGAHTMVDSTGGVVTITGGAVIDCNIDNVAFRYGFFARNQAGSSMSLQNVAFYNNGGGDFAGTATSVSYIATSDSSATGVGAVTGITSAAFTNYASDIFTAATSGPLDGTGSGGQDIGLNGPQADGLAITPADLKDDDHFPMDANGQYSGPVGGDVLGSGSPGTIVHRINGGAWVEYDAAPTSTFTGTLTLPVGVHTVEFAWGSNTSITTGVVNISVGFSVFTAFSQSNLTDVYGVGAYTGPAGYFKQFTLAGQVWEDGVSTPNTSFVAEFANLFYARFGIPIGFIKVAVGSTTVNDWQSGNSEMTNALATFNAAVPASATPKAHANFSDIGESDMAAGTLEAAFKTDHNAGIDYIKAQTGLDTLVILPGWTAQPSYDDVRTWLTDDANSNPNALLGPSLVGLYDGLHYDTESESEAVADAVFASLQALGYFLPVSAGGSISILSKSTISTVFNSVSETVLL